MSIEIYAFPPSPRAFKVMAVANYLGLDWTLRMLDIINGGHKTPEYEALNPNLRMPTLKDGDYVIWESNAICQYLASKKPESGLLPKDERARLDVTRWQFWDLGHWDPTCRTVDGKSWRLGFSGLAWAAARLWTLERACVRGDNAFLHNWDTSQCHSRRRRK